MRSQWHADDEILRGSPRYAGRVYFAVVPHTAGTREYLTCETGEIELVASGEAWRVCPGDVVVFRGDQRHSYANPTGRVAVGYSVVVLNPVG